MTKWIREIYEDKNKFLLVLIFVSLLVRTVFMLFAGDFNNPEMFEHGKLARNLYENDKFAMHWPYPSNSIERLEEQSIPPKFSSAFIPPLNPYIISYSFKLFGDNSSAYFFLMFLNALLGVLAVFYIYKIALIIFGYKPAVWSGVLAALFAPSIYGVITFSGSQLYQLLALMIIYFSIKILDSHKLRYYFYFAITCGLQTLTRSEFLLLSLIFAAVIVYVEKYRNRQNISKGIIVFVLLYSSIATPWAVRNYNLYSKFVPVVSHPWHEIWRGNNINASGGAFDKNGKSIWLSNIHSPHLINKLDSLEYNAIFEIRADSVFKAEALSFILNNKIKTVFLAFKRLFFFWSIDIYTPRARNPVYAFFVLLTVIPFFYVSSRFMKFGELQKQKILLMLIFCIFYSALIFFVNLETRYQIYLLNTLIPISGYGLYSLKQKYFHNKLKINK